MIGRDNMGGPRPSLVLEDVLAIQAVRSGNAELARAYGISVRTLYRYKRAKVVEVDVLGHTIGFVQWRPGQVPRQIDRRRTYITTREKR